MVWGLMEPLFAWPVPRPKSDIFQGVQCWVSNKLFWCGILVASSMTVSNQNTLSVHRCRFVDFTPSPITAFAVPPLPPPPNVGKHPRIEQYFLRPSTLAIGHANGSIDLCQWASAASELRSSQAWVLSKVICFDVEFSVANWHSPRRFLGIVIPK